MSEQQPRSIYQLKITLNGIKPPIWRRFLVPDNLTLGTFHVVLQIVMGWENYHLHQFTSERTSYGTADEDFDMETEDEDDYQLSDLLKKERDSIQYEYDFGDSWEHKIVLEKILPVDADFKIPRCTTGKRACPPEDCGGIWGYQDLLEAIQDPSNTDHEEMLEWVGEDFDPEAFSIEEVNHFLAEYWSQPKDNPDIRIIM